MAAAMHCHPTTIDDLARTTGKRLRDARMAARLAAGKRPPAAKPATSLPWSILQLFDTLMAYFQPAAEESENEQEVNLAEAGRQAEKYNPGGASTKSENLHSIISESSPTDPRRTWIAWRVFLAAAFGLDRSLLATDQGVGTKTS